MKENTEKIRERILSFIDAEYGSDAAFERDLSLQKKTVNNWRRGRSSSFMAMLPVIAEKFGVSVEDLMDMPPRAEGSNLSEDEMALLTLYRKSRTMPKKMRSAMKETIEHTIRMYMAAASEAKIRATRGSGAKDGEG